MSIVKSVPIQLNKVIPHSIVETDLLQLLHEPSKPFVTMMGKVGALRIETCECLAQ